MDACWERHDLPPCSVIVQSREDKSHVSDQRLRGCGQRPWDHHLENRGELGWRHTFLLTLNVGADLGGSPPALVSPLPVVWEW